MKIGNKQSQCSQDIFAFQICGYNSTYLEIGAGHPKNNSNTWWLEKKQKWKGLSFESDQTYRNVWAITRKNKILFRDATKVNYMSFFRKYRMPKRIGYLQIDIDNPINCLTVLTNILESGISFKCLTFEHEEPKVIENSEYVKNQSEILLDKFGYKKAVTDVLSIVKSNDGNYRTRPFETWWVNKKINFETTKWKDWIIDNELQNFYPQL